MVLAINPNAARQSPAPTGRTSLLDQSPPHCKSKLHSEFPVEHHRQYPARQACVGIGGVRDVRTQLAASCTNIPAPIFFPVYLRESLPWETCGLQSTRSSCSLERCKHPMLPSSHRPGQSAQQLPHHQLPQGNSRFRLGVSPTQGFEVAARKGRRGGW